MAGHDNYHLPHRDLVAGYIETVAMTNLFDAMVYVPVCDDVVPGLLMALVRIDIPSIVVTGGYMSVNRHRGKPIDPLTVANKHFNDFKEGRTTKQEFGQIKDRGCKGTGACPVMGTANTMGAMTEALGLSLPGTAATPGADSRLQRIAFAAGRRVMDLLLDGIRSINDPLAAEGGLMFLQGSLAPEGALVKKAAVPLSMHQFKGPALLFET
jgi:dihydroxy-acid dehydratase